MRKLKIFAFVICLFFIAMLSYYALNAQRINDSKQSLNEYRGNEITLDCLTNPVTQNHAVEVCVKTTTTVDCRLTERSAAPLKDPDYKCKNVGL